LSQNEPHSTAATNVDAPIVFAIDEKPLSLSIPTALDYIGRQLACALYEPLVHIDPNSNRVTPGAAARWRVSRDGLTYTFHLARNRCWSNGEPVTAENFLPTLVRAYKHPFWSHSLGNVKSVVAETQFKLVLNLQERISYFLALLSTVDFSPIYDDAVSVSNVSRGPFNGPYALRMNTRSGIYNLEPNRHYPDAESRSPLQFLVISDAQRALRMYDEGKLHVTCNTSFPFTELISRQSQPDFHSADSSIYLQIEINPQGAKQLHNRRFRQALYLALDRAAIARSLQGGLVQSAVFGPRCFRRYSTAVPHCPDPTAARNLLAAVGKPSMPLVLHYNNYYPNKEVVEAVAAQWKQVLDLDVKTLAVKFGNEDDSSFDLLLALRFPTFLHPYAVLQQYSDILPFVIDKKSANQFGYLLTKIRKSRSQLTAEGCMRTASRILVQALPALPLFDLPSYWLSKKCVYGFEYPDSANFDFKTIRWKS
jgi:oligopeptide transport system substrate-binding protein